MILVILLSVLGADDDRNSASASASVTATIVTASADIRSWSNDHSGMVERIAGAQIVRTADAVILVYE